MNLHRRFPWLCVYYFVDYYVSKEIGTSHTTLILINVRSDFFFKFNYQIHYRIVQFYPITLPIKSISSKPNYFTIINYITNYLRLKQQLKTKTTRHTAWRAGSEPRLTACSSCARSMRACTALVWRVPQAHLESEGQRSAAFI